MAGTCVACRAFSPSALQAITTDEGGCAWAGDDKGKVKSLRVAPKTSDGVVIAHTLKVRGALRRSTVPASHAETRAVLGEGGMVEDPLATKNAHDGMVTAIAAAVGRVWTSGGDSAFVCLKEWTQQGEYIGDNDLKSMGAANQMVITSPLVRICVSSPVAAVAAGTGSVLSTRSTAANSEVPQTWQLLTAHNNGIVQVWAMISGLLRPVLRIGERTSPAKGIVICEQLGALCTAHTGEATAMAVVHSSCFFCYCRPSLPIPALVCCRWPPAGAQPATPQELPGPERRLYVRHGVHGEAGPQRGAGERVSRACAPKICRSSYVLAPPLPPPPPTHPPAHTHKHKHQHATHPPDTQGRPGAD